jgi:acyl-coenzyme A synthetase/AMP-(fatty) acid ligase
MDDAAPTLRLKPTDRTVSVGRRWRLDAELQAFCSERLHHDRVSQLIEFVDELPETATRKIHRSRLRKR